MAIPESLKFDVRVRERLLKKGLITEAEVQQHLESLSDRAEDALDIGIKQPALQTEAEREVIVVRTLARPAQPAPPPRVFGEDDESYSDTSATPAAAADDLDDEDDDLDDEDEAEDKPAAKAVGGEAEAAPAPAPAPAPEKSNDDWG